MTTSKNRIVGGTVFYPTPEEFKRGSKYDIVCVFYTSDGESLALPNRILSTFKSAFGAFMSARPARTDLDLPALKITSCKLFKPNGLKHLANLIACVYGKLYAVDMKVVSTPLAMC